MVGSLCMLYDSYADMGEPTLANCLETAVAETQTSPELRANVMDKEAEMRKLSTSTKGMTRSRRNNREGGIVRNDPMS